MADYQSTPKYGLRYLLGSSPRTDVDAGFLTLAQDVEARLAPTEFGTFAARPVSTPGQPGKQGRRYLVVENNTLVAGFVDLGTGWALEHAPTLHDAQDGEFTTAATDWAGFPQGPQLTAGLAGVYQVDYQAEMETGAAPGGHEIALSVGANTPADRTRAGAARVGSSNSRQTFHAQTRITLNANSVVGLVYRAVNGGTALFRYRRLSLTLITPT